MPKLFELLKPDSDGKKRTLAQMIHLADDEKPWTKRCIHCDNEVSHGEQVCSSCKEMMSYV